MLSPSFVSGDGGEDGSALLYCQLPGDVPFLHREQCDVEIPPLLPSGVLRSGVWGFCACFCGLWRACGQDDRSSVSSSSTPLRVIFRRDKTIFGLSFPSGRLTVIVSNTTLLIPIMV